MTNKMKIRIIKNGPFKVTGGVPISQKNITMVAPDALGLKKVKDIIPGNPHNYRLCRCGKSKNKPFCDGTHAVCDFLGAEVATKDKYIERAGVQTGPGLDLLDDNRCAFARFCHRKQSEVWTLTKYSDNPDNQSAAIAGITACPSGRLVARDKNGNILEKKFQPEIEIVNDPMKNCSAGIFVKGGIPLESADGTVYEVRNRMALCRCGHSNNMPFCDATHVSVGFDDTE